jgi:hypothetical protein
MSLYPSGNDCYLQGSSRLSIDSRVEIRDGYQNIINRFPIQDFGAVSDQGEFFQSYTLTTTNPTYTINYDITGYTGDTPDADIDILYIATSAPIFVKLAEGIDLNSVTPGSRNPNGAQLDVASFLVLKSNTIPGVVLEEGFDQRLLPFSITLQPNVSSAQVSVYLTKFSQS